MSEKNITLAALHHDKLGVLHCGVIRQGCIACAGDIANIEDGAEVSFPKVGITARRNGDDYTFSKAA